MKIQLIGLGNVGRSLIELIVEEEALLRARGHTISIVAVSDSQGSAIDKEGLSPEEILKFRKLRWKGFPKYRKGYCASRAIAEVESDAVVEMTPSTLSGEPGLSNIKAALNAGKNVVTANKGPLVVAYRELVNTAKAHKARLLYEATVAAHLPVFCLIESCFKADELQGIRGILNATTNYMIEQIEKGKTFEEALRKAIKDGWAETNYSDDIDGVDAARKTVILANALFKADAKLADVHTRGIRNVENLIKEAQKRDAEVKLVCEITETNNRLKMTVQPKEVSQNDPLATVNHGSMGIVFRFKTSRDIFVSAQFSGPKQTAYAVLNDLLKIETQTDC
jgi:homoserine dehydrogenase